jgi:hypothetical protein
LLRGMTTPALPPQALSAERSTRASLTNLRKRGFTVERVNDDATGSVYHIKPERALAA